MFDFFIALFGGLYYGGKQIHEKSKLNTYEKSAAIQEACRSRLQAKICTSFQTEQDTKSYILNGEHFEKICSDFEDDFRFVFGSGWRELLRIPPKEPVLNPQIYKKDAYSFYVPANHIYWVYRLILASKGKVDRGMLTSGYSIGGIKERGMCIKFAQRIEQRLLNAGVCDVHFVLEQNPDYEDSIKIETLCNYPFKRIW